MSVATVDRLHSLIASSRLDRELVAGADPQADALRALRAAAITTERSREGLARSIEHVLDAADEPVVPSMSAAVPIRRSEVRAARAELQAVAERLRDPEPISPRGAAMLRRLLNDGTGPLYWGTEPVEVHLRAARLALDGL